MGNPKNWNKTTPAAPSGKKNIIFQQAAKPSDPAATRDTSGYYDNTLAADGDVNLTSPSDGDLLTFDGGSSKWKNSPPSGGGGGGSSSFDASSAKRKAVIDSGGEAGSAGITGGQGSLGDLTNVMGTLWTQDSAAIAGSRGQSTEFRNTGADSAGGLQGSPIWMTGTNIQGVFISAPSRITDLTMWIGFTDQNGASWGVGSNPAGNYAAFRFDAINGDTNIQCVTKDASTQTIVDSGIPPVAGQAMRLAIVMNDSVPNVKFYINGVLVATITTHLPTTATVTRYYCGAAWHSSALSIYISHIEIGSDL